VLPQSPHLHIRRKKTVFTQEIGTYGGVERCIQGFVAKPEEKKPLEDVGIHWIILKEIFKKLDRTLEPGLI
jgi:hypothetical protein